MAKTDTAPAKASLTPPAPKTPHGAFGVQLASVKSKGTAEKEARRLNRTYGEMLGGHKVVPVRADLGRRGIFYRLRAGPLGDRAAAAALCRKFSRASRAA